MRLERVVVPYLAPYGATAIVFALRADASFRAERIAVDGQISPPAPAAQADTNG
jgi:hypothetical protein